MGGPRVAGVDEVGRGCLAGPIVVAAVVLDHRRIGVQALEALRGLDDSKRVRDVDRERLARAILAVAEQVVVLTATAATIDREGLHRVNLRLLATAVARVRPAPDVAIVDGLRIAAADARLRTMAGADRLSAAVACASIVAKAARDRLMRGPVADAHPGFGFDRHVGYGTAAHRDAVRVHGPTTIHRRSFRLPTATS